MQTSPVVARRLERLRACRRGTGAISVVAAVLTATFFACVAGATPGGALDSTFDNDGKAIVDLYSTGIGQRLAIQPDAKVVIAGWEGDLNSDAAFALVRLNGDGTLDPSFGVNGRAGIRFGAGPASAFAVAVQQDGAIVVGGWAATSDRHSDFALARFKSDGSVDRSLGRSGTVLTDFGGRNDAVRTLLIQGDGKIVAVGDSVLIQNQRFKEGDFAIARYNTDGTLDASFDGDGRATTDFGSVEEVFSAALQADGRIVAAGATGAEQYSSLKIALARYNADGGLDASFDTDGRVVTDFPDTPDAATGTALQPDGRILVAGGPGGLGVVRYGSDGHLDTTFGKGGVASVATTAAPTAVAVQQNAKIVVLGALESAASHRDLALARYLPNGRLDPSFGRGGSLAADLGGIQLAGALALQADGRIVATAVMNDAGGQSAVARFLPGTCSVPKVRGKTLAATRVRLAAANCKLGNVRKVVSKRVKKGRVVSQSPAAGAELEDWALVNVVVSRGRK